MRTSIRYQYYKFLIITNIMIRLQHSSRGPSYLQSLTNSLMA